MKKLVLIALAPALLLATISLADTATGSTAAVWVRFADKGLDHTLMQDALAAAERGLSAPTRTRRDRVRAAGDIVDVDDLPVADRYLAAVAATGATLRHTSRWLNAVSCNATPGQIETLESLPFVTAVEPVATGVAWSGEASPKAPPALAEALARHAGAKSLNPLDYGASLPQLEQIGAIPLHDEGLTGRGVTVAFLDTGFELAHECFAHLDVVGTWDFVEGDEDVGYEAGDNVYSTLYGTAALSVLAGYSPGNLIGAAWNASVILAKTEDLDDETPAEEDNWIAALEWAENLGADVVNSGLGYYDWYRFEDFDGATAHITVAAEMAAARGVIVVSSVGDQRSNSAFPHILAPSDGRSVIAVGSCDANGVVTSFSSPGPTADGRIKPDVLALGQGTVAAFDLVADNYIHASGSNYATPLIAGAVALMLEQNPRLSPHQVANALRGTASRSAFPDNDFGYGVADAPAALAFGVPAIVHSPLTDTEGGTGVHTLEADITASAGLDPGLLRIVWRKAEDDWRMEPLTLQVGDTHGGRIPTQSAGTNVEYYLTATDLQGRAISHPLGAPATVHTFRVGADTTPPTIDHVTVADVAAANWPPVIEARVDDAFGVASVLVTYSINGQSQGAVTMPEVDAGLYRMDFPFPAGTPVPGLTIAYGLMAADGSSNGNIALNGMHEFRVVDTKGSVLLVDDRGLSAAMVPESRAGAFTAETTTSIVDLAAWLTGSGYAVTTVAASSATLVDFVDHDAVFVSSGSNFTPMAHTELRRAMAHWVEQGGRLLVAGGEVSYAVSDQPAYPELLDVLRIVGYVGEAGVSLRPSSTYEHHPLVARPHRLDIPLQVDDNGGYDWGAADMVRAADEAFVPLQTMFGSTIGGLVAYDDNTGPAAGQTIFLPFDVLKVMGGQGPALLDNVLTWLLTREPDGPTGLSGRVTLAGGTDHGGVTVRLGVQHSTVTATDGTWALPGLWGGHYTVTAEIPGYGTRERSVELTDGVNLTGTDFYLVPVHEVTAMASPGMAVPDNDAQGVTSAVDVGTGGKVVGVTVDIDLPHYSIGQLVVSLVSPTGTRVTLHDRTGGTVDDLVGSWPTNLIVDGPGDLDAFHDEEGQGTWLLEVADVQFGATGSLQSWQLNLVLERSGLSAADDDPALPAATGLVGNTPNPFNPRTVIAFDMAQGGHALLEVYDLRGRRVQRLASGTFAAGRHTVVWDGRDSAGAGVASGVYFYRLRTPGGDQVNKMTLMR